MSEHAPDDPALWGQSAPAPVTHTQPEHTEETAEQRARRCPHHKHCVCDHTECRAGWLDGDEPNPTPLNEHNVMNRRCPRCHDAQIMAAELDGMRGRKRH